MNQVLMVQWVVYRKPADFPTGIMARKWEVTAAGAVPTNICIMCDEGVDAAQLSAVRRQIQKMMPGASMVTRFATDEPQIVEVWL